MKDGTMMQFKFQTAALAGALSMALFGCGVENSSDGPGSPIESAEQGFSSAACATATEDTTLVGDQGVVQSPGTYNTCTKSFVVNVQHSNAAKAMVIWNDAFPASASSCRDSELHAMVYTLNSSGAWEWRDQKSMTGNWLSPVNLCQPLVLAFDLAALGGHDFRIAATARRISGGNPTRKLAVTLSK